MQLWLACTVLIMQKSSHQNNAMQGNDSTDCILRTSIHGVQFRQHMLSHLVQQRPWVVHHVGKCRHHVCQVTREEAVHLQLSQPSCCKCQQHATYTAVIY